MTRLTEPTKQSGKKRNSGNRIKMAGETEHYVNYKKQCWEYGHAQRRKKEKANRNYS